MLTLAALEEASQELRPFIAPTALYSWPLLNDALGCEVFVKHENHAPTGSFKARCALLYLLRQSARHISSTSFVTASRGNFGIGIAWAASILQLRSAIIVPQGTFKETAAAIQSYGAFMIEHGADFEEAHAFACQLAEDSNQVLSPGFDYDLVVGAATYALEIFRAIKDLDAVYVPVGLGTGICGLISVRDLFGLKTKIIGVVAQGADGCARSIEAGEYVLTPSANTFAEGICVRGPDRDAFALIRSGAERVIRVSDDEIAEAIRLLYRTTHNTCEGAAAAGLAGLRSERSRLKGKKASFILCGQNINQAWMTRVLQGETPTM
ncbi:L-threonine dehydratase biosynthetic IlvA [Pseudovibrio axinellae]|uniref:L-threonine dehydratase biosynthetic IlvA n=1 Tax=Pseudovibrio axinellae TaxID=989403 RepID=A0A165U226_9HYPH|nr:threonine dehydratase [Pseudovibrio axinellae]KZL09467.1 L-threonine dehydratase biosynthetic IlvA [Pseudovibrio axinellae]SEQ63951.1 threonine dehydratase [Pseudovibrio axinellae]